MTEVLLSVRQLSKTFGDLKALDSMSMDVSAGEIVALVGQNGSGKSTLVKVLAEVEQPDWGSEIDRGEGSGTALHFIHQDLGLIETLTTIENLDLDGRQLGISGLAPIQSKRERDRAHDLVAEFGATFDVSLPVSELSAGERSLVAIARALQGWHESRNVLILDEPTAALHGDEVEKLFDAVRRVAARGAGIIFISHRLDEVVELSDRVVVLRDGKLIADVARGEFDQDRLVELITGELVSPAAKHQPRLDAEPALTVRGLSGPTIDNFDFAVRAGEVLGISGVLGSGREQVCSTLFGIAGGSVKELRLGREILPLLEPVDAIRAGLGYVPADRYHKGAVMTMSARENMTLPELRSLSRWLGWIDRRAERREVKAWIERVDLRPPQPDRPLRLFSGGNQQKVVLAKWLRNEPRVLLLDEPTQGVDVGAKTGIYELIARAAGGGAGIVVASSDTEELALICDRVLVLYDGRLKAEIQRTELTQARLVSAGFGLTAGNSRLPGSDNELNHHA